MNLKWEHQPVDYGSMTAVVRYKTPYIITNTSPLNIFFALGTDVALRSVLGITSLLAMGAVVDLAKGQLVCLELNKEFMLQLDPPGKGIPDGSTLESFSAVVPDEVPSHIPSLGYLLLQYTASDGTIAPVSQSTYSSNIVVKDSSLVYHSPQVKSSK